MTIFKKSIITLGAAVMIFSLVFIIFVLAFMDSLYYEINMTSLAGTARTLKNAIGAERLTEIFLNDSGDHPVSAGLPLGVNDAYRLTLIAPSGYVLWDSQVTDRLVNHIDREEVIAALEGREESSRRESISTGMRRIYYALPVFDKFSNLIGVFRLSISIPGFTARVSPVIISFIIFICFFIAFAFWAIVIYSRSLSSSLRRLVNIARSSAPLLSGAVTEEPVSLEFLSLEKTLRAMNNELNLRFEQAKSEGIRLEAILNGMSEAVFAVDSSFKLLLVNPKARQLFNLSNIDISGMTLLEATRSTELAETAKKAVLSGAPFETELTFHSGLGGGAAANPRFEAAGAVRQNTEQYFQIFASPLAAINNAADNSKAGGVVLVMQEITRLVKLERVRRDFVANVSHELRTPIQIIKGFSETLIDDFSSKSSAENEDKAQAEHFIGIIHKNALTMENLTNDLLILSSLENNEINVRDMEECLIAPLVNEAVSAVEVQAKNKNIDIIISCPEDLNGKLYGSLIIQALINLLDNGIKYSPPNSKLRINVSLNNDDLLFEVLDKGIGIPSDQIERIFERFYRVDRAGSGAVKTGEGGTGLGLSIVRHIALLHKGSAEAESRAGEGSVFRIRVPSRNNHNHTD